MIPPDLLATLLRDPVFARVLVFTRTKHGADRVLRHLVSAGIEATAIHGNKSQPQRNERSPAFATAAPACLSPRTSPPAASMSKGCRTSSISSCRMCPKISLGRRRP